jgi:hypothetical protein
MLMRIEIWDGYARRSMIAARLRLAALPLALAASLAPAYVASISAAAAPCQFKLGFKALHDALPNRVGGCMDDEAYNVAGDSLQHASGGLLAWRHADNWTAFTDGYRTWVNGPNGVQERLNTERFPWEADQVASVPGNNSVSSSSNVVSSTSGNGSSSVSVTSSNTCSAAAHSGSVSAVGLNASTTITGSGSGDTTIISNHSSSSSSPGVATTGC